MTAYKHILLMCDTAGCNDQINIAETRVYEARVKAREHGWTNKNDSDTCPVHNLI